MEEPPAPFAVLLRRHRQIATLTQEELAERAGVSWRTISDLERGVARPRRDTLALLAGALALSEDERTAFLAAGRRPSAGGTGVRVPPFLSAADEGPARTLVYIAHAQGDHVTVGHLTSALRTQGMAAWVDEHDLQPGTPNWEQAIRDAIRACLALLLIASSRTRSSRYVADELRIAELYGRRVYPIWIEGDQWMECVPLGWGGLQYLDARDDRSAAFVTLAAQLRQLHDQRASTTEPDNAHASSETTAASEPRNPYKGLRPFSSADAGDFFGREQVVASLLTALHAATANSSRFLALVGASGSGKSSVLLAGLLPRLRAGALPGSEHWHYLAPVLPGAHPLDALAQTLAFALPGRAMTAIRDELEDAPDALSRLTAELAPQQGRYVVVVIDQFEELFATAVGEEERRHCIDLLVDAVTVPGGRALVLLTLRADIYERPLRYPALAALLSAQGMAIVGPNPADLRQTIEGPAALADVGITFEGDLVGDLLFDLGEQPGALPLLQFTLDQLFERREGRRLTREAYRALGGVRGTLARHAEGTYAALAGEQHRALARALFLRLIDPGATVQDTTRRRASMTELLLPDPGQTIILREVIDAFIGARLLVTARSLSRSMSNADVTIEVCHEALIREWDRLDGWLHEAREDIQRQQAISADAAAWARHGRSADHLYRGSLLLEAEAWAVRNTPSAQEMVFIEAAQREQSRQQLAERERQDRQLALARQAASADRRAARRLRLIAGILALFLVVAASLSVVAATSALRAQRAEVRAVQDQQNAEKSARAAALAQGALNDRNLALSADLAAQAIREAGNHDDLALLLAAEAYRTSNTIEARSALLDSLESLPPRLIKFLNGPASSLDSLGFSPDGRFVAAGTDEGTVELWNVADGTKVGLPLTGHRGVINSVAFSPDGTLLASGGADGTVRLWRASGDGGRWSSWGPPLSGGQNQIREVSFADHGSLLAASSWDGSIWLWDLRGQHPQGRPLTMQAGDLGAMAVSPDGTILASGGLNDVTIQLWDVARRKPLGAPLGSASGAINQLAFSPSGMILVALADDGTVQLWDLRRRRPVGAPLTTGLASHGSLTFSPDGHTLAVAVGQSIRLWSLVTRQPIGAPLSAHDGDMNDVAFSPSGALLVTASTAGSLQVWDTTTNADAGNPLATALDSPHAAMGFAFSRDGSALAVADDAGAVRLWNVARGKVIDILSGGHRTIATAAFSPDGTLLSSTTQDGAVQVWDIAHRRLLGAPLDIHAASVTALAISPDDKILAIGYPDFTIRLWDIMRRRQSGPPLTSQYGDISALAFSPNGAILASGSYGTFIQLWNVATHRPRGAPLLSNSGPVFDLAFSSDGTLVASTGGDDTIRLWDVGLDRSSNPPLIGQTAAIYNVAFSPNGSMLASNTADGAVQLWSVPYRTQIGPPLMSGGVEAERAFKLAFNRSGTLLAVVSITGPVLLWDVDPASWAQRACRIANRNLTLQEWHDYLGSAPYHQTCPS